MLAHEDVIAMFILFNTANSYKYVGKYGIFHIKRSKSALSLTSLKQKYLKELSLIFSQPLQFRFFRVRQ